MAKRIFRFTALAASITLAFGLAGCGSDSKKSTPPDPVVKTDSANFNVELSGFAVKGTLADSIVTVQKISDDGSITDIAYRLSMSQQEESYTVSAPDGTSDADLQALIAEKILAENPSVNTSNSSGMFKIYLEDDFNGAVIVKVKTMKEGDDSWLRCDAYKGCGVYDNTPSTIAPNDGDFNIEFGEWYKEDLMLSTVKYIPATESPSTSRSYITNVTVLTELASKILLDGITTTPINTSSISDASLQIVLQLLGPDGVVNTANVLGDISTGGAIDLSDLGGDISLDAGMLSLAQIAASLQTIASKGENGKLAEIISNLARGVSDGNLNEVGISQNKGFSQASKSVPDPVLVALAAVLQSTIKDVSAILVAIVTNDKETLEALGITIDVISTIEDSLEQAVKSGAITEQELINTAKEVAALVDSLGCTGDACIISEKLYSDIADRLEIEVAELGDLITAISDDIDNADLSLVSAESMAAKVDSAQEAIDYFEAATIAHMMVFGDVNLTSQIKRFEKLAIFLMDSAEFLGMKNDKYAGLVTAAMSVKDNASGAVTKGNDLDQRAQSLLDDATAKLAEHDGETLAAKLSAEAANTMAVTKQSMSMEAKEVSDLAYVDTLTLREPITIQEAMAFVAAAKLSVTAITDSKVIAMMFVDYAEMALDKAKIFKNLAKSDADKALAEDLIDLANVLISASETDLEHAERDREGGLSERINLVEEAEKALKEIEAFIVNIAEVKSTTQSFADINVITVDGRDALADVAVIIADVLVEAGEHGSDIENEPSKKHPGWTYTFNEDNMTIAATHATQGSFQVVVELSGGNENTSVIISWSASLKQGNDGAIFEFVQGKDCGTDDASGSCMKFEFEGNFDTLNMLGDSNAKLLSSKSWNQLIVEDGETGFDGSISHMHMGLPDDNVEIGFKMAGKSDDVTFDLDLHFETMGENDVLNIHLMVGDNGYSIKGEVINDGPIEGKVSLGDVNYGDIMKLPNGAKIVYFDGEVVIYEDLTFTLGN
jgi:hypothetical protein